MLEDVIEPAAVRAARWTAWLALAGALVQFGAMLGAFVTQALSPSIGGAASAPGESVIFLTVVGVILAIPPLVAFAAIRAANGRPAGRSVLWTFGPLAVALSVLMLVGAVDQLSHSWNRIGPIYLMLVLVPVGTVLFTLPITVSALLWLLPAARADLAEYRDYDRGSLGRSLVSAAAGLLGGTVLFAVATAVLMSFAPQEIPVSDLTRATVAAGVTAVAGILLLGGVVLTRLTGRWALRAIAYGAGMLLLVWQFAAVTMVALGVRAAAGDSAVFYTWTGVVIFSLGAVLHLVAQLLLAMPSVSTWLADCLEARTGG
ncbi:hypothetical protein MB27_24775 [Actinoplanes utahensis]|uniref:Uncharacterized protein n=1 Tax=Actinoplanes utahensis TaxID=1869 RepID=A0A0A6UJ72_ACTUT|nr:hypothetical protein MB27_24775 [Actinoplanes utahensis]